MKTKSASRSAFFNPRVLVGFVLCSIGVLLALAGLSESVTDSSGEKETVATTTPVQSNRSAATFPEASASANPKLTYKIIDAPKHTY